MTDPAVLRQLRAALETHLQAAPDDVAGWWQLAQWHRALGDLEAAAVAYERCATAGGDEGRAWGLAGLMRGAPSPGIAPGEALCPVPFLALPGFLDATSRATLWSLVAASRHAFRQSTVYEGSRETVNPEARASLMQKAGPAVRHLMVPALVGALAAHRMVDRLGVGPVRSTDIDVHVTSHLDGAFFGAHRDSDRHDPSRRLSFVYYTHCAPARFTGGDLLLFDETADGRSSSVEFTRIVPADNLLVCFPADRLHEVTRVTCASANPLDGRVTVNGWLHADRPARP